MSAAVPIQSVELDSALGLLVRPGVQASASYEHVYRAAMAVRWHEEKRAFFAYDVKDKSPAWWFQQIVAAVESEYALSLELRRSTQWFNVPDSIRRDIVSLSGEPVVG